MRGPRSRCNDAVEADQRLEALTDAFAGEPDVTAPGSDGRGFGAGALKVEGPIVAMVVHGALVVKLPEARVAELVSAGTCAPFDSGKGRPMREWAAILPADPATDLALASEAVAHVRSVSRPSRR